MLDQNLSTKGKKLYAYYLRLLQNQDYSQAELQAKAKIKGYSDQTIVTVLNLLTQQNLVNDYRLAENLLERYKSEKGIVWLRQKLYQRKLPKAIVEPLLQTQSWPVDLERLKIVLAKKYRLTKGSDIDQIDPKTKGKIINFLLRQGYPNPHELFRQICSDEV